MRVRELSEDELLARIVPLLPRAEGIEVPSGDDCAMLRLAQGRAAVSTDMLVEGTHFTRQWSGGYDVGWRSAMQNLADSVAMGARPVSLFVCLELPGELQVSWVEDFARGMGDAARVVGAGVDGGDLTSGPAICVGVTVIGDPEGRPAALRSAARPGQSLIHCGNLGFSAAGYELLSSGWKSEGGEDKGASDGAGEGDGLGKAADDLGERLGERAGGLEELVAEFLRPSPPLASALLACREGALGALMDVSDGLVRDARRMAKASGVWIDLDPVALGEDIRILRQRGFSEEVATACVMGGGEDHGFLATARGRVPEGFRVIGRVGQEAEGGRVTFGGQEIDGPGGWDHFAA